MKSFLSLPHQTIRNQLAFWFVFLALLPAVAISLGSIIVGYYNGRQQSLDRLASVANLKNNEIIHWLDSRQRDLSFIINDAYGLERIQVVYNLAHRNKYYESYYGAVRKSFLRYMNNTPELVDISLLDSNGKVILSTDESLVKRNFFDELDFIPGSEEASFQSWINPADPQQVLFITSIPIVSTENEFLGVMISRANSQKIFSSLSNSTGLGKTGTAYLVNTRFLPMGNQFFAGQNASGFQAVHSEGIDHILNTQLDDSSIYTDYRGQEVIGVYQWIAPLQVGLIVEQELSEAFAYIFTNLIVNMIIAAITLILAISSSIIIAQNLSKPIVNLANTANLIASGDLNHTVRINRKDEIGSLAVAFNSMTSQLRELISNLEQRVSDRTHSLHYRALQLETSAHVSREITSILQIDHLLVRIVDLIRDSFDYSQVHIYLVEEAENRLVLCAAAGKSYPVENSVEISADNPNGKAILLNQTILIDDPQYSKLVLPLRIAEKSIGTLTVADNSQGSFPQEDITMVQSLGDQIAIAIENANLYKQSRQLAVMEERNRLARDLHDSVIQSIYSLGLLLEGWRQRITDKKEVDLFEILNRTNEINQQVIKEMRLLIYEMRPPILGEVGILNALQKRLDAVENRAGIQARLLVDDFVKLPYHLEENLYYIALEALNNALKHSHAEQITVHFSGGKNNLALEISDDGCGFDLATAQKSGGMGLKSIQDRVKKINASMKMDTSPGKGTRITVEFSNDISIDSMMNP